MRSSLGAASEVAPGAPVVVLAAMREELDGIRALATESRGGPFVEARLAGRPVLFAATGDGADNATRVAGDLLRRHPVCGLIVAGTSGALSPSLAPGSLVVARRVLQGHSPAPPPDPGWVEKVLSCGGVEGGTVVSSPAILWTRDSKAAAYAGLGSGEPAVVDLETAAVARVAADHGVPYIAVRAISDSAGEDLPLDFNRYRDESGRIDRFRVALAAVLRPRLIAPLWRLKRRVAMCSDNLAGLIYRSFQRGMP